MPKANSKIWRRQSRKILVLFLCIQVLGTDGFFHSFASSSSVPPPDPCTKDLYHLWHESLRRRVRAKGKQPQPEAMVHPETEKVDLTVDARALAGLETKHWKAFQVLGWDVPTVLLVFQTLAGGDIEELKRLADLTPDNIRQLIQQRLRSP